MGRDNSRWRPEAMDIIRQYPKYKKELEQINTDYAYAHGGGEDLGVRVQTSSISDGAADPALRAMSDERWQYLDKAVRAVDYAIAITNTYTDSADRLKYIKLRFWDGRYTHMGASMQIPVHANTAGRWSGNFVREVARKMGFI